MELIKKLRDNSKFITVEKEDIFIETLKQMAESKEKKYILEMLSYLDDNSEYNDIMKIIIGMAESFEKKDYVEKVIEAIDILENKGSDWLEYIHNRILNSKEYTDVYKEIFSEKKNKEKIKNYLLKFAINNEENKNKIAYIIGNK